MKFLILFLTAFIGAGGSNVYAQQGGKVNNPWQPVDPNADACSVFLPAGDLSQCTEVGSNTSGITYFCEALEATVVCPSNLDEEEDD